MLGSEPVLDEDAGAFHHMVFALENGNLFGLHAPPGTAADDRFDEHRAGLDHVSFGCADRAELEGWKTRLDELGIPRGEIADAHYGSGLSSATRTTSPWSSSHLRAKPG